MEINGIGALINGTSDNNDPELLGFGKNDNQIKNVGKHIESGKSNSSISIIVAKQKARHTTQEENQNTNTHVRPSWSKSGTRFRLDFVKIFLSNRFLH